MSSGKILVAQGGGPTAVINQSLVGVALEARRFQNVQRIYGARHGVRGIVNEDFVDLTQETSHNLEMVAGTPASALGSTRDKPDLAYCQEMFKVLRAHEMEIEQLRQSSRGSWRALLDSGAVVSGPASRALPAIPLALEGDQLVIAGAFTAPPGGSPA